MRTIFLFVSLLTLLLSINFVGISAHAEEPVKELRILRVSPDGEDIPAARQITILFNRPVVPIGQMERSKEEIPVTITPEVNCQWRWLNVSSLSCNLSENDSLKTATKYEITINKGIKAEDGAEIAEPYKHNFTTNRPDVTYTSFSRWTSPGMPYVRVQFNQKVTSESVKEHIYFNSAEGKRYSTIVEVDTYDDDKDIKKPRSVWIVSPKKELPLDNRISLKTEKGLVTPLGPETSISERTIVEFNTYPEFEFAGVKCTTNDNVQVLISEKQPQAENQLCNPMAPITLAFTSPVFNAQIKKYMVSEPAINLAKPDESTEEGEEGSGDADNYSRLYSPHMKGNLYDNYLPTGLKAATSYTISVKDTEVGFFTKIWHWLTSIFSDYAETDIEDEFNRKLLKPFTVKVTTDHRKPNFEIIHHQAVLEKNADTELPLYVNNLKQANLNYRSVTPDSADDDKVFTKEIPAVQDIQFAVPMGVKEILNGKSGAVYGELATNPEVNKPSPSEHSLFAIVTPYQLHVKLGHYSSMVWVTDLATGDVVPNAKVTIYKDSIPGISSPKEVLSSATTNNEGVAIFSGTDKLDPTLLLNGWEENSTKLFVRVDKDNEMALMPLSNNFMLDTWRASGETIYHNNMQKYGHMQSWGTTAQGIYRAGDTMQYKLYVRNQNDKTLKPAPRFGYTLEIVDPTDKVVETVKNIELSEFGSYSGEFSIPKQAAVGWYQFRLSNLIPVKENWKNPDEESFDADNEKIDFTSYPMRVLVSDFTPSPFKVSNEVNGKSFTYGNEMEIETNATLHSGGAFGTAEARVTVILESSVFETKDPILKNFYFSSFSNENSSEQIFQKIEDLDDRGQLNVKFTVPEQNVVYGNLIVESAVQDDRGKYIASQAQAEYTGVDRLVGLRSNSWVYNVDKEASIDYAVVDTKGALIEGTDVDIKIAKQKVTAAKVKGAGNAYITNFNTTWEDAGECKGTSAKEIQQCTFTPKSAGSYTLTATIKDSKGKEHSTKTYIWVAGKDYVLWDNNSDSYLEIIPEQPEYKVGDTARYMVKNPYPGAKALITVERYGIIDSFVKTLDGSTPIIEFPVKADYLPGFYLSVLVTSPRVDKPIDENQVDLGKPTFRMGYVTVPVKDKYKEMAVTATTDMPVYRPRDKVKVKLHAEPKFVKGNKEPIEMAVAVLDESVFDMIAAGRNYFDPYEGFYKLESLDLRNFSLLMRLVGRQKFEKKGANPGGDGGSDLAMRNIFKFVSYWNPSIKTDANGNAEVEFEVPDNLTGWRILTLATTPSDIMGLGEANFKVNRPTELRPVMPNQVSEGDDFKAGFSLMNRTEEKRTIKVQINAQGDVTKDNADTYTESVTLEPYKRVTIFMPVKAAKLKESRDIEKGNIKFTAYASDDVDSDGIEQSVPVNKLRSLETGANYGTTTEDKVTESIAFPDKINTDAGGVSVTFSPSVIANVEGAFRYMKEYPYTCWEQKLTVAVMASHYQNLKDYISKDFTWAGSEKLPSETLGIAANYQAPNGGMTYFNPSNEYVDPYLSAYTALAFNWLRSAKYSIPSEVEKKLHEYLLDYLKKDVAPDFYSQGMNSSIRAVALAALAESGKVNLNDIKRYNSSLKQMSLFGKSNFAMAASKVKGAEKISADAMRSILSHASESGGKFTFNEQLDDGYSRLLSTPLRENCSILSTISHLAKNNVDEAFKDIPFKMVRAITQTRKTRDHWENTQENIFCMNALVEYSKTYENVKPEMEVSAQMDGNVFAQAKFDDVKNIPVTFERQIDHNDPGRKTKVEIKREGSGRLYYSTTVTYSPSIASSNEVNAGIDIRREYSVERKGTWQLLDTNAEVKRGELVRVDIYVSIPTARNFVVVDDPVPGGLEPVNSDFANVSKVDADKGGFNAAGGSYWFNFDDWYDYGYSRWSFYHKELRHDSVRFYSDYLSAGNYHLSYTAQAIAEGKFTAMPTKAAEMYDADIFGKGKLGQFNIEPQK